MHAMSYHSTSPDEFSPTLLRSLVVDVTAQLAQFFFFFFPEAQGDLLDKSDMNHRLLCTRCVVSFIHLCRPACVNVFPSFFSFAPWTENERKTQLNFLMLAVRTRTSSGGHRGGLYLTQTLNAALIRSSAIPLSHMQIPSTPVPE